MYARRVVTLAACTALLAGMTACADDDRPAATTPTTASGARLYGTDGNMINSFGDAFKDRAGVLRGMKGTTPLTPLTDDFKKRLKAIQPGLDDFLYAGETYDAVLITAIAAQQAGTTAPAQIARYINGVTTGGEKCDTAELCLRLARQGRDVEYRGISLKRGGFTDAGEPSTASYATLHFGASDRIDDGKTEFVGAGDAATTTRARPPAPKKAPARVPDAPLRLGGLLPKTGDLSFAYPPLAAGAALAVKDVNTAGGVFGKDLQWLDGDDGTNPAKAKQTVARHIADDVHVIIGAGASGISREVLPDVIAAGRVLFSPCNTDAGLSTIDDKGLYFRTAPSDLLQGPALSDVIMRDGSQKVTIIARKDSYGEGLQATVRAELEKSGIPADRLQQLTYEPPADGKSKVDFTAGGKEVASFGPDAVLVIGFGESAEVIKGVLAAGVKLRN